MPGGLSLLGVLSYYEDISPHRVGLALGGGGHSLPHPFMIEWEGHNFCPTQSSTRTSASLRRPPLGWWWRDSSLLSSRALLMWAKNKRSGQHLDSGRIFLHDRNFIICPIPQTSMPL